MLPDKLPDFSRHEKQNLPAKYNFMFVSSFGRDEPIDEVLKSVEQIEEKDTAIYISGNFKKLPRDIYENAPDKINFTGFLSEPEYVDMLHSVDGVIVLTTSDFTMLCGCYEAVSAEKALITSKKDVLVDYFNGALFVENTAEDIARGINSVINDMKSHTDIIIDLKKEITKSWAESGSRLMELITSQSVKE